MPKCDFNKAALKLYQNHTLTWMLSCKFAAYFPNTFLQEHLWRAAFDNIKNSENNMSTDRAMVGIIETIYG